MTNIDHIKNKQPQFLSKVEPKPQGPEKAGSEKEVKEMNIYSSDARLSTQGTSNVFDKNYKLSAENNFFTDVNKTGTTKNNKDTNIFTSNLAAFHLTPEKTGAANPIEETRKPNETSVFSGDSKLQIQNNSGNSIFGVSNQVNSDEYGGMLSFINSAGEKAKNQLASQSIKPGGKGASSTSSSGDSSVDELKREQQKLEEMDTDNPFKANKVKKQGKKVEKAADKVEVEKTRESEDHKANASKSEDDGKRTQNKSKNEEKKAETEERKANQVKAQSSKGSNENISGKSQNSNTKLINKTEQDLKKGEKQGANPTKTGSAGGGLPGMGTLAGNAPSGASSINGEIDIQGAKMDNSKLGSVKSQEKVASAKIDEGKATQEEGSAVKKVGEGLQLAGNLITTVGTTLKATGNIVKTAGQGLEVVGDLVKELGQACGEIPYVGPALQAVLEAAGEGIKQVGKLLKDTVGPALVKTGESLSVTGKEKTSLGNDKVAEGTTIFDQGKQLFNDGKQAMGTVTNTTNSINNLVSEKCGQDGNSNVKSKKTSETKSANGKNDTPQGTGSQGVVAQNQQQVQDPFKKPIA